MRLLGVLAILWLAAAPIEVEDHSVTDSDEKAPPAPTPIAQLIATSGQTYTAIADRMREYLGDEGGARRQTVAHYALEPIVRMPTKEMMTALAHALDKQVSLVLHLFILSHEQHYRAEMGIPERTQYDMESQAHPLADRIDALDPERRYRLMWVLRALLGTAEAESAGSAVAGHGTGGAEGTGARLRRLGDRLLVDLGAAHSDDAVREDAEAVLDLLARRRGGESKEPDGSSRSS